MINSENDKLLSDVDLKKKQLRKSISELKKCLSNNEKEERSLIITEKIETFSEFQSSENVLLYSSLPDEVFTGEALKRWFGIKKICLPVVVGDILKIKEDDPAKMEIGSFGILEPDGEELVDIDDIDLMIIPGVAFDKSCNRLGRGKGYYDKLLSNVRSTKIGICYDCQITDSIPVNDFDVTLDYVVTESLILKNK